MSRVSGRSCMSYGSKMSGMSGMPEMFLKAMKSGKLGTSVITGMNDSFSFDLLLLSFDYHHVLSY